MSPPVPFRTLQAISDLDALVIDLFPQIIDTLPITESERKILKELLEVDGRNFGLAILPETTALAWDSNATGGNLAFGAAVAMSHTLRGGTPQLDAVEIWQKCRGRFESLPARQRAALANAGNCARSFCTGQTLETPTVEECNSVDLPAICERLRSIAREVTDDEMRHISKADYGRQAPEHLAALTSVIFDQDCIFSDSQSWVPSEVVELVSHVPSDSGFVVATAVLLHHCLVKGDMQGHTDFRWGSNAAGYRQLPSRVGEPILAAFRYFYETDASWAPYEWALFDIDDNRAVTIPPAAPQLTRM